MSRIVPFEELQGLSGYRKPGPLRRWLVERKIEFVTDKAGKPFTTLDKLVPTGIHLTSGPSNQEQNPDERGPNWSDPPARRPRKREPVLPS
jgi:hypothetical protein